MDFTQSYYNYYTQTKKTVNKHWKYSWNVCFDQSHARPCNRKKTNGFWVTESSWFSICFERHKGLIFIFISQKLKVLFLSIWEPHANANENKFERFWRIKFFDKPTQRLGFSTFQIKATQAAVISPWCKNCHVLPPAQLEAESSMPSSRACIIQRLVLHFENDTFSNLGTVHQAVEE